MYYMRNKFNSIQFIHVRTDTITITVTEWEGETLEMARISRLDMGAYLCIASNGIPPTVSKQIKVSVDCKYTFDTCTFDFTEDCLPKTCPFFYILLQEIML